MKKSGIYLVPETEIEDFIQQYIDKNFDTDEPVRIISRFEETVAALVIVPNGTVEIEHFEAYLDAYRFHHGFDVEGYYHDETDSTKYNEDTFNEFDERKLALINHESGMLEFVEFEDSTKMLRTQFPNTSYGVLGHIMKEIDVWYDDEFLLHGLQQKQNPTLLLKRDASRDYNDLHDTVLYGNIVFASCDKEGETIGLNEEQFETLCERMVAINFTHHVTKVKDTRLLFKCYKELYSL